MRSLIRRLLTAPVFEDDDDQLAVEQGVRVEVQAYPGRVFEGSISAINPGIDPGTRSVRLEDVARIELGAEDYDSTSWYKGKPAIFIGVEQAPGANPLTVAQRVRDLMPELRKQLPEGLAGHIPYDASVFIEDSINEVFKTLLEAVGIVLVVIYLSLGSMRAAVVPAVAVPLSLVGAAFLMLLMGFSVNLLTLLAMVLAIGLVVDDAIVVVENVHRHIEMGKSRYQAAIDGARELGLPIIAMTTTLVAVYAPIGFMGGLVGSLFTEFAFSLAGAVLISGVVALTLSPMLSARVLKAHGQQGRFELLVHRAAIDALVVGEHDQPPSVRDHLVQCRPVLTGCLYVAEYGASRITLVRPVPTQR